MEDESQWAFQRDVFSVLIPGNEPLRVLWCNGVNKLYVKLKLSEQGFWKVTCILLVLSYFGYRHLIQDTKTADLFFISSHCHLQKFQNHCYSCPNLKWGMNNPFFNTDFVMHVLSWTITSLLVNTVIFTSSVEPWHDRQQPIFCEEYGTLLFWLMIEQMGTFLKNTGQIGQRWKQ